MPSEPGHEPKPGDLDAKPKPTPKLKEEPQPELPRLPWTPDDFRLPRPPSPRPGRRFDKVVGASRSTTRDDPSGQLPAAAAPDRVDPTLRARIEEVAAAANQLLLDDALSPQAVIDQLDRLVGLAGFMLDVQYPTMSRFFEFHLLDLLRPFGEDCIAVFLPVQRNGRQEWDALVPLPRVAAVS